LHADNEWRAKLMASVDGTAWITEWCAATILYPHFPAEAHHPVVQERGRIELSIERSPPTRLDGTRFCNSLNGGTPMTEHQWQTELVVVLAATEWNYWYGVLEQ
jgi:hypothetical protein